jgi:Zn-dependent protease
MSISNIFLIILIYAIPILFAITVHEVAHGWMASKCGDQTARMMGRLTLNPIKHIDPIGTVLVPAILFYLGGFIFGWAKPVPVNWQNLRHPRRDGALVAIAGPLTNLLMALFWIVLWKIAQSYAVSVLVYMAKIGVQINLILMLLNLIPVPPLDGSRVVASILPPKAAIRFNRIEPFGFLILIALLALGVLGRVLFPVVVTLSHFLAGIFGVS